MSMSKILIIPAVILASVGCKPTSAKLIEGTMTGFLSTSSSFTLIKGNFDPSDVDLNWNVDCRELEAEDQDLRLDDPLPICGNINWRDNMHEAWMFTDAWRGFQIPLDPWRGEGILTNEGDLQVGFHQRLPGGEGFRFNFAIRPDFAPTTCVGMGDDVTAAPVDGSWLDEWSKDLSELSAGGNLPPFLESVVATYGDGTMYHLNARAYQFNPDLLAGNDIFTDGRIWTLPEQWRAGFARATFVEEEFHSRPTYYAKPSAYLQADNDLLIGIHPDDIYFADLCQQQAEMGGAGVLLNPNNCADHAVQERDKVLEDMRSSRQNFNMMAPEGVDVDYMPLPHFNNWRMIDRDKAGIDGWSELNYGWVVLSAGSDAVVGGAVEGAFSIILDPDDSNSRIVVQGTFEIPKVRKERWAGPDLRVEKFEEAGITPCIDK